MSRPPTSPIVSQGTVLPPSSILASTRAPPCEDTNFDKKIRPFDRRARWRGGLCIAACGSAYGRGPEGLQVEVPIPRFEADVGIQGLHLVAAALSVCGAR